jgi:S-adenosylmethionine uptake transporter
MISARIRRRGRTSASGAAELVMRARAAKDGSTLLTLTSAVIPMVLLSPAAVGAPPPTWWALGLAVLAGLLGNLGIQLLARAYAGAEAQALGVLEFTALPWAALFGWLFFDEAVRPQVWARRTGDLRRVLVGGTR